jgi:hypothetical protein
MFGWFYNKRTRTLNRYMDNRVVCWIMYDEKDKSYVLFSISSKDFDSELEFLESSNKENGFHKLIILAEVYLKKLFLQKMGAFYLDKESVKEDEDGHFRVD